MRVSIITLILFTTLLGLATPSEASTFKRRGLIIRPQPTKTIPGVIIQPARKKKKWQPTIGNFRVA